MPRRRPDNPCPPEEAPPGKMSIPPRQPPSPAARRVAATPTGLRHGQAGLARLAVVVAAALAAPAPKAPALINVNFTPIHLVSQSERVLVLTVGPVGPAGEIPVRVVQCLKGKAPAKPPALTCPKGKTPEPHAKALRGAVGKGAKRPALLFVGKYAEEVDQDGGPGTDQAPGQAGEALLHVAGKWYRFFRKARGDPWALEKLDTYMEGTWAGGTDMLLRAVNYVLKDPDPIVPTRTGAAWAGKLKVATLRGKVHGILAVDLPAPARAPATCLHVLCDGGDRILQWNPKTKAFADVAGKLKLRLTSRSAAWGDLDADGRLDLASWDGKGLSLWFQKADGTFAEAKDTSPALRGGCLGLSVLDLPAGGRPGILASTPDIPVLLRPKDKRAFTAGLLVPPPAGKAVSTGLGQARPCLVADFDGDRVPDILTPFAKDALLYTGKAAGGFQAPRRCGVGTGKGRAGAFTGDYDADGLLDVFVAAEQGCGLWHNQGGAKFAEALHLAGEVAYISKPNGVGGATCDVNNDGRQDVLILYDNIPPQVFFNRGFRSFGHSHRLDLQENQLLPAAGKGQQAGLMADLNADGAQDLALVPANGEVWVFWRDAEDVPALSVRAVLDPAARVAGPITVTGWSEERCLGAWNVVAGSPGAFFGLFEPGSCKLKWHGRGGKPREKTFAVEDRAVRFVVRP